MIKIIGISKYGDNVLEFLKKQNYQVKRDLNYQFILVADENSLDAIKFNKDDKIFTITKYGDSNGMTYTKTITNKAIKENIHIKNLIILPFSFEDKEDIANNEFEQLFKINQNVEILADNEQDKKMSETIQKYNLIIFDKITRKNQIIFKNFIIKQKVNNKIYKAIITYWSKDYHITLIEPYFKVIGAAHLLYMIPFRFDFKDGDTSKSGIIDIEEIGQDELTCYIKNEKGDEVC